MQFEILTPIQIAHIRGIARELGTDWYYHEISSHAHCAKLRNRAERHIWVHFMVSQGRFRLSAGLDRDFYDYASYEHITVALGRSATAIAGDIRRRLLPALAGTIEIANDWRAKEEAKSERHGWLQNLLRSLCGPLYVRSDACRIFEYCPPAGSRFVVTKTIHSGGEYDMTLKNISLDDAVRIAAIVCQEQQRNPDETP